MWICSFALDQNADIGPQLGQGLEECPFALALKQANAVILLIDENVEPLERSWCAYELFLAWKTSKSLTVWAYVLTDELWHRVVGKAQKVDLRNSKASVKSDETTILNAVAGQVGLVNHIIKWRTWPRSSWQPTRRAASRRPSTSSTS